MKQTKDIYVKLECHGKTNTGKSYLIYSIVNLKPPSKFTQKKKIIVFTNEATYQETIDEYPEAVSNRFTVYQHETLYGQYGFMSDWVDFGLEYGFFTGTKEDPKPTGDFSRVENEVLAIVIDELLFIYELYVDKECKRREVAQLEPKWYGTPRTEFTNQMKHIYRLPCHVLGASQVRPEWESFRNIRIKDGQPGALQFRKTGGDEYKLPDKFEYVPSIRIHLYQRSQVLYYSRDKDGRGKHKLTLDPRQAVLDSANLNERQQPTPMIARTKSGKPRYISKYYGDILKNKFDRDQVHTLEKPDVPKILRYLLAKRKAKLKR
jgi:hypothetical protein